jgi:hypothetical protein
MGILNEILKEHFKDVNSGKDFDFVFLQNFLNSVNSNLLKDIKNDDSTRNAKRNSK